MKPHFRLWHLFAFTAIIAAAVFIASNLGIIFEWQPKTPKTARHLWIMLLWNGDEVFYYDSWGPPGSSRPDQPPFAV